MKNESNKPNTAEKKDIKEIQVKDLSGKREKKQRDYGKLLKYGGFNTALIVIVIIVTVCVNIIFSLVEKNAGLKADLTREQLYTLSELSQDVIGRINEDLVIYSFADDNAQTTIVEKTLERYTAANNRIQVKVVDPAKNPALLRKFSTSSSSVSNETLVVTNAAEDKFRVINRSDYYRTTEEGTQYVVLEQKLTNALMFMTDEEPTMVYLLSGHGEQTDDPANASAVQNITDSLEGANFQVSKLNLITEGSKLVKGDVLMIVGPSNDLTKEEYDLLQAFLKNHGKLVMFFDPAVQNELTYFKALFDYYMIRVGADVIYEQDSSMRTELSGVELVPALTSHNITDALIEGGVNVYVHEALSLDYYSPASDSVEQTSFMNTSENSVSVPIADYLNGSYTDKLNDYLKESHCVGMALSVRDSSSISGDAYTRIAVFGSSEIIMGKRQNSEGNQSIMINSVSWVENKLDSLPITAKAIADYSFVISDLASVRTIVIIVIAVLPAVILGTGFIIYKRRKNL